MDDTAAPTPIKFPEQWAAQKKLEAHWLAGAMVQAKWQQGVDLVNEAQFDAAVTAVQSISIR